MQRFVSRVCVAVLMSTVGSAVTFAGPGDLYVSESSNLAKSDSIRRFTTDGSQSTFASGLYIARGLAFDEAGNLFAINSGTGSILEYNSDGAQTTFASGEDFASIVDLEFGNAGDLFVSKSSTNDGGAIVRFTSGGIRSEFVRRLNRLAGLTFNSVGDLYVSNREDDTIMRYLPDGTPSVIATGLDDPTGLAFDEHDNLFVADQGSGRVIKIAPNGVQSTFATLVQPVDLVFDDTGNLFVSDYNGGFLNDSGFIYEFAPNGTQSIFASGLDPTFMVFQPVPEPGCSALIGYGLYWLIVFRVRRRDKSATG